MTRQRHPVKTALVAGSSGMIGSEAVEYVDRLGRSVRGIDNNMCKDFFGFDGDTMWNLQRLETSTRNFHHHNIDTVVSTRYSTSRTLSKIPRCGGCSMCGLVSTLKEASCLSAGGLLRVLFINGSFRLPLGGCVFCLAERIA